MTMLKERSRQKEIKIVSSAHNLNNNNNSKPPYQVNALSKISKKSIPHYLKPTATSSSYVSNPLQPTPQKQILDSKSIIKTSLQSPLLHSKTQKQTSNCTSSTKTSSRAASHSRTQNRTPGGSLPTKTSSQTSFLPSKSQKQTSDSSTPSHHKNRMQKVDNWSTVRNSYHTVTKLSETRKKTCPISTTTARTKSQNQTVNGFSRSRTTPASKAHSVCVLPQRPSSADGTKVRTSSIPSISSLLSPIKAQSIIRSNSKIYGSSTWKAITSSTPMILTVIHEEEEEEKEVDVSEKDKESKGGKEIEERVMCGGELVDEEVEMEHPMSYSGPFDIRNHQIEQMANKFSIGRQNKVKALAGAFETAISSQKFGSRGNNYFI